MVERNDLDLGRRGRRPPPRYTRSSPRRPDSPRWRRSARSRPNQVEFGSLPVYDSAADLHLRPVEIFRVDPPASIVQTYSAANPVVVSGDVGSLLPSPAPAWWTDGPPYWRRPPGQRGGVLAAATWAITDGNQRRYLSFGGIRNNRPIC